MATGFAESFIAVRRLAGRLQPDEVLAMHRLLAIMAHGEHIAMEGARLQAQISSDTETRKFLTRQARHEQFHSFVFSSAADVMASLCGAPSNVPVPHVMALWRRQIAQATQRRQLAESLLIQQVYLEGLGQVILMQVDANLALLGDPLRSLRQLILRQEAQHHAFGLRMLAREVTQNPAVIPRLERMGRRLLGQAEELLDELAETFSAADTPHDNYIDELCAQLPIGVPGTPGY